MSEKDDRLAGTAGAGSEVRSPASDTADPGKTDENAGEEAKIWMVRSGASLPSDEAIAPKRFDPSEHRLKAAKLITLSLLVFLGVTFLTHVAFIVVPFYVRPCTATEPCKFAELQNAVGDLFKVWLPIMTGFMGSAIAFYFSQRNGQ